MMMMMIILLRVLKPEEEEENLYHFGKENLKRARRTNYEGQYVM